MMTPRQKTAFDVYRHALLNLTAINREPVFNEIDNRARRHRHGVALDELSEARDALDASILEAMPEPGEEKP